MPELKADFGSGLVNTAPSVRNDANTGWQACEVYVRNDADTGWIKLWPLALTIAPTSSFREANANVQISQVFSISGSTSGTWSISPAGASLTGVSGTGVTVAKSQASGSYIATLTYTPSDGRPAVSANINWQWGTIQ